MMQGGIGGPEVLVEKSEKVLSQLSEAWPPVRGCAPRAPVPVRARPPPPRSTAMPRSSKKQQ